VASDWHWPGEDDWDSDDAFRQMAVLAAGNKDWIEVSAGARKLFAMAGHPFEDDSVLDQLVDAVAAAAWGQALNRLLEELGITTKYPESVEDMLSHFDESPPESVEALKDALASYIAYTDQELDRILEEIGRADP
jgi:hypothetical protein